MQQGLLSAYNPFKLSSIWSTIPSSISCGEAPGYVILMLIIFESVKGKKDDLNQWYQRQKMLW